MDRGYWLEGLVRDSGAALTRLLDTLGGGTYTPPLAPAGARILGEIDAKS